jgi:hypothetical protein
MRTAGRLRRQVLTDTPLAKFAKPLSRGTRVINENCFVFVIGIGFLSKRCATILLVMCYRTTWRKPFLGR